MVDCEIFGRNPVDPQAVNVLLHTLTAAGLFLVLRTMTDQPRAAVVSQQFSPFIRCGSNPRRGSLSAETS